MPVASHRATSLRPGGPLPRAPPSPPPARRTVLLLPLLLGGCLIDAASPQLGTCAEYPDGVYDFGEIGIGTCLAGPADLQLADNDGDPVLLVTNANPWTLFTGGSLLAIPWSEIDLTVGRQELGDMDVRALDLPDFAGGLGIWDEDGDGRGDLALVTDRLSEDALLRQYWDDVQLVDVTNARQPVAANRGTNGGASVQVQSDPVDVVVDDSTGLAFVSNRTTHSVSILDLKGDTVEIVLPWPEQTISAAVFDDADASGSTATLTDLTVNDSTLVPDEQWTLDFVAGTWRLWVPDGEALLRWQTQGDGAYRASDIGGELDPSDGAGIIGEVRDPSVLDLGDTIRMYFEDDGAIRWALADTALVEWSFQGLDALSQGEDSWDLRVGAPSAVVDDGAIYLFYSGTDDVSVFDGGDSVPAIGLASSQDGQTFARTGDPVLEPTWDHELGGIDDPAVWYDGETGQWRMAYTAWDGARFTIGHAVSDDLVTWESDPAPLFELGGVDVAAPVVMYEPGRYRMWYARDEGGGWSIGAAVSPDGYTWTDLGTVVDLAPDEGELAVLGAPPGPAAQSAIDRLWRLSRESTGTLVGQADGGASVTLEDDGLSLSVAAGFSVGTDALGADSAGGIRVDSIDAASSTAWLTVTSEAGTPAIAIGSIDPADGALDVEQLVLEGDQDYDDRGASHAVVVDGQTMLYAARRRAVTTIARATSSDGLTWTKQGEVLTNGEDWDSQDLVPGSIAVADGTWQLFYSGFDGETWRIGEATSTDDGASWTKVETSRGWTFPTGSPGEWDDSGVRDPYVVIDADGAWHMWYAGFDGDAWRVGYATRASAAEDWTRFADPITDEKRPIMSVANGMFHPDGLLRPVVVPPEDAASVGGDGLSWMAWYAGRMDGVDRVGRARGRQPARMHRTFAMPTPGDRISFSTEHGDESALAIPLDTSIEGGELTAPGIAGLTLDEERGFLYVVSKLRPYIFVIDVRDDSPLADGSEDSNYLDIESVIVVRNSNGGDGFRQVLPVPGTDRMLATNDNPDALWVLDLSGLQDDTKAELLYDNVVGSVPAPRGGQRDAGVTTQTSVGVGQMVLHPDGRRLFISNFNANSIGLVDLTLGPWGTWTHEITQIGENPFAMVLGPDGDTLVFANYTGEVSPEPRTPSSTIGILDIDEDSPRYLEVLTWLVNQ